ncbi:hypothetical protein [Mesorhizobium retamae]|uniref:Uncharacterized protein n=1 Tax=Mesorhizobium retamae TaxID=2912854 RepID=A0ABS9QK75_9HYPH|nr:hypothetical protein [Mesorhizobium sp. IRAMC:0171]MCG7507842.1 hypothetical protein [Mesorhizobium sp. IRAMC:0171]
MFLSYVNHFIDKIIGVCFPTPAFRSWSLSDLLSTGDGDCAKTAMQEESADIVGRFDPAEGFWISVDGLDLAWSPLVNRWTPLGLP